MNILIPSLPAYTYEITSALLVIAACVGIFNLTKKPLQTLLQKHTDEYMSRVLVFNIYRTILYVIGAITALGQLGINIFAAMTGFGIAGIAIGFAAKDALANIIAGFMIFWDKPFRVGDWVEVDNHYGEVNAISLRSTRIHTNNNFHVVIPNQIIANTTLVNHHKKRNVRTTTYMYIPYDSDVDKALEIVCEAVTTIDRVLETPAPGSGIADIDGGRIKIAVLVWTTSARDAVGISGAVRQACKRALDQAGYGTPYQYSISAPKKVPAKRKAKK